MGIYKSSAEEIATIMLGYLNKTAFRGLSLDTFKKLLAAAKECSQLPNINRLLEGHNEAQRLLNKKKKELGCS